MKLESHQIEQQPRGAGCAIAAIINLHRARGVDAPTFAQMAHWWPEWRAGANIGQMIEMLELMKFPVACILGQFHPPVFRLQLALMRFLFRFGFTFLIGFTFKHPQGGFIKHVVVADGYRREGFEVLDSAGGESEDSIIEFEPNPSPSEYNWMLAMEKKYPHGARRILPFEPLSVEGQAGLNREFVAVLPHSWQRWRARRDNQLRLLRSRFIPAKSHGE